MNRYKKIVMSFLSIALLNDATFAANQIRLGGKKTPSTSRGSGGGQTTGSFDAEPARSAGQASISCDPSTTVSYSFIESLAGGPVGLTKDGDNLIVSIPEFFNACIDKIKLESKVGSDNNVYLKFALEPSTDMRNSSGESTAQKYSACVDGIIAKNPDLIKDGEVDYEKADSLGLISRNKFKMAVSLKNVDKDKDSEVVIASLNSLGMYDEPVYGESRSGLGDSRESTWNCLRYEKPADSIVRVFQTQKTNLLDRAEAICKNGNASLHDVEAIRAELLKSETLGNFSPLIRSLGKLKYNLLKQDIDDMAKKLDQIEDKFEPSEEDIEEGNKIGVSKAEAKKLGKEYEEVMKKFNTEILPQIKSDLQVLLTEREDASEERIEEIDKEIEKLSELLSVFDRENTERVDKFALFMRGMKEANVKSAAKEALNAVYASQFFKRVYVGDTDDRGAKLTLKEAEDKYKQKANDKYRETVAYWDDERELKQGSDAPIKRRQKILSQINQKAQAERQNFSNKYSQSDKYIQQYIQRGQQTYCSSGGDQQKCAYFMQTMAPTIYNQFNSYKQQQAQQFQSYYNNKYGNAITQQQNLISGYQNLSQQYQLSNMRQQLNNGLSYGSYSSGDMDYSFFDTSSLGGSYDFMSGFSMSSSPSYGNDFMQQMQFNNTNRSPATGTNFSNPYAR